MQSHLGGGQKGRVGTGSARFLLVNEVRRSEATRLDPSGVQKGGEICTNCAFAVGASDVNGLPWLRVVPEQLGSPLKPELYHQRGACLNWAEESLPGLGRGKRQIWADQRVFFSCLW